MKKQTKKILSICAGILGVSTLAVASAIGIVSCSSTNSSTTVTKTSATTSPSSTSNSSSSSPAKTTTSSSSTSKSNSNNTKPTSSSSPSTPQANTTGLVTLNTFLTTPTNKEAVGQLISTNVYACGSKITLNANYTPPPNVTSGSNETDTITYAWYSGDDLITGQVNSQCNIAGIFSTTTYKVIVTCNVYKETTSTAATPNSPTSSSQSNSSSTKSTNNSTTQTSAIAFDTNSSPSSNNAKPKNSPPSVTKTLIKTYTCSNTLTVTVDYSNLNATLVYGANQMGTITSNLQTALAVNLQYKFEGNGTTQPAGALYSFSISELKKLPASTISFLRYSFGQWKQLNPANTSANKIQNLDYSYTPTGIYPLQAQLNIGGYVLKTNMLKVNTTYDGSVLNINNLPANLQSSYNFTTIMMLYLQQSLKEDGNNAPFMQLVNSWGQGFKFSEATTSNNQYSQVSVNDLSNLNVSWINPSQHHDGLMVSAVVNVANNVGLELMGWQNYKSKQYAYSTSGNLLIPNGDTISWTLPFGDSQSLQWTVTKGQVSNVNWNINTYDNNVFYNYGSSASPSWKVYNWACANQFGYPTTGETNTYWGYKVTSPSGTNVLQSLIASTSYYKNLKNDQAYLAYNDFPMINTDANNAQAGYIALTSNCVAILNNLYQASIVGIASLENS